MKSAVVAAAICATILFALPLNAKDSHQIKFSSEDLKVLKRVQTIKDLSAASAKLLLSAPVIEILASPDPVGATITLSTADWEGMVSGASNMKKIAACQISKEVQLHLVDEAVSAGAREYFDRLVKINDSICHK